MQSTATLAIRLVSASPMSVKYLRTPGITIISAIESGVIFFSEVYDVFVS